jgi:hypothetical protein
MTDPHATPEVMVPNADVSVAVSRIVAVPPLVTSRLQRTAR